MEFVDRKRTHVHWDNYFSKMQKLIADEILSDVTLISEGKRFPASRIVLSASSDYFETMFTSSFKEKDSVEIEINDVKADDLHKLIKVCCSGTLDINPENAESLLKGAHLLQLRTAITICCDYILEKLTPDNCLRFWLLVKHLLLKDFEEIVFQFCLANFPEIPLSQYVELSHEELDEIVKNTDLDIRTEGDVLDILMSWVQHESQHRLKYLTTLATRVDFKLVMPSHFSKYLDFFFQFEETVKFQQNMMKFYLSSTNDEFLELSPRKSTFAPLSLSVAGVEIYKKKLAQWQPCRNTVLFENIDKILAVHIESNKLYIFRRSSTDQITISFNNLQNGSYNSNFCTIPYKYDETAIAFSYLMAFFIGNDNTICELNLMTKEVWKSNFNSNMSVARNSPGTVILDDKLYVVGGEFKADGRNLTALKSTECFSIKEKTWSSCAALLHAVSDMGIAASSGKIYTIGGVTQRNSLTLTNRVQCYDPVRDTWTAIGAFPICCYNIKTCIWNGKLWASGGVHHNETISTQKKVYCYEPENDEWKEKESLHNRSLYLFTASSNFYD